MDELLLRRARQGDPEAFESLLTPLEGRIWRICWHYTGEREAASDCAQETMLKIWRSLDSYRGDAMRKAKRDRSQSIEPLREAGFDPPDPEPGTEEKVIAADRRQRLREGIAQLPEDQREALVMTQLEHVSYEDAAARLGVSEGTIKSRVSRAKAKLQEWMSEDGELSPPGNVQQRERRNRS